MPSLSPRLPLLVAFGAFAVVACSNISLNASNSVASGAAVPPPTFGGADAGTDDGNGAISVTADAGVAPSITGNPLCNYGFATAAAHVCFPDTDNPMSQQCLESSPADAGLADAAVTPGVEDDDGGGVSADAAAPIVVSDAAPEPTPACHVIEETTADGGAWKTQTCTVVGAGTDGAQCQHSTDCAATFECVGTPGQCRRYCCGGNSVCATTYAPSFCDVQPVVAASFVVPVCMPISGCSLFGHCQSGETCAIVKDDGTTSCVQIGTAKAGDPCDANHCGEGLTCLGNDGARTCFQLCHVAAPTECVSGTTCTGSAQLFTDPQIGICQ